jgi:hypothetical protein
VKPLEGCSGRHGTAAPLMLVIACRCKGCEGELHCASIDALGTQSLLRCTVCRCAYTISATKEVRR